MVLYVNEHESQYGADRSAVTRRSGCTWTSVANALDAVTAGAVDPEPDAVHAKVSKTEETNPYTEGWSIDDAALAVRRFGLHMDNMTSAGWAMLVADHDHGFYLVVQGDSDQFGDNTCSGAFDGDHAIGIHPVVNDKGEWRIDDPICGTARWEDPAVIRRYAEKLAARVRYGRVLPKVPEDTDMVKITKAGPWTVDFPAGTMMYDLAGKPLRKTSKDAGDHLAPSETVIAGTTYLMVDVVTGGVRQFVLIRANAATDRRAFVTQATCKETGDARVAAAVAPLESRIKSIKGKVAANAADVAND